MPLIPLTSPRTTSSPAPRSHSLASPACSRILPGSSDTQVKMMWARLTMPSKKPWITSPPRVIITRDGECMSNALRQPSRNGCTMCSSIQAPILVPHSMRPTRKPRNASSATVLSFCHRSSARPDQKSGVNSIRTERRTWPQSIALQSISWSHPQKRPGQEETSAQAMPRYSCDFSANCFCMFDTEPNRNPMNQAVPSTRPFRALTMLPGRSRNHCMTVWSHHVEILVLRPSNEGSRLMPLKESASPCSISAIIFSMSGIPGGLMAPPRSPSPAMPRSPPRSPAAASTPPAPASSSEARLASSIAAVYFSTESTASWSAESMSEMAVESSLCDSVSAVRVSCSTRCACSAA